MLGGLAWSGWSIGPLLPLAAPLLGWVGGHTLCVVEGPGWSVPALWSWRGWWRSSCCPWSPCRLPVSCSLWLDLWSPQVWPLGPPLPGGATPLGWVRWHTFLVTLVSGSLLVAVWVCWSSPWFIVWSVSGVPGVPGVLSSLSCSLVPLFLGLSLLRFMAFTIPWLCSLLSLAFSTHLVILNCLCLGFCLCFCLNVILFPFPLVGSLAWGVLWGYSWVGVGLLICACVLCSSPSGLL